MRWILSVLLLASILAAGADPSAAQIRFEVQPTVGWYEPTRSLSTMRVVDESGQEIGQAIASRDHGVLLGLRAAVSITDHFGVEASGHRAWNRFATHMVTHGIDRGTRHGPDWHIDALTVRPYAQLGVLAQRLSARLKAGLAIMRPDLGMGAVTRYAASVGMSASWALGSNLDLAAGADSYIFRFNPYDKTQNDVSVFVGIRFRSAKDAR
jgi:hypothetical protein